MLATFCPDRPRCLRRLIWAAMAVAFLLWVGQTQSPQPVPCMCKIYG